MNFSKESFNSPSDTKDRLWLLHLFFTDTFNGQPQVGPSSDFEVCPKNCFKLANARLKSCKSERQRRPVDIGRVTYCWRHRREIKTKDCPEVCVSTTSRARVRIGPVRPSSTNYCQSWEKSTGILSFRSDNSILCTSFVYKHQWNMIVLYYLHQHLTFTVWFLCILSLFTLEKIDYHGGSLTYLILVWFVLYPEI